ncbi:MAG TPA: hypothetical protein V6D48_21295 [Oculatellaceae cyanobacterium]
MQHNWEMGAESMNCLGEAKYGNRREMSLGITSEISKSNKLTLLEN